MKRIISMLLVCMLSLSSCATHGGNTADKPSVALNATVTKKNYTVKYISVGGEKVEEEDTEHDMKGVWVSQFDMHPIYRNGGRQRGIEDYGDMVDMMLNNLVRDGFNTIFLQLRPNGDSMYESGFYPNSKYIAGAYGGEIGYDAVEIFVGKAKALGLAVHAWINPFRLCSEEELLAYSGNSVIAEWANDIGGIIKRGGDGLLYLDPSYGEVTELITAGAREILQKYNFDGIHIDDYFYPTEFELDDSEEFAMSGYGDIGEFRRANITRTVKALYDTVHEFEGKVFGIAPAGNIYSLSKGWYADIYKWCGEKGYADYILPQLYFGFKNAHCPFETILADWESAVTEESGVRLYIGLSAAKCVLGSEGKADTYAGSAGKYEWRDEKDILARSIALIDESEKALGWCMFTYSSLYDPLSGIENPLIAEEKAAFAGLIDG